MKNHSACHLLQAALRELLGSHVEQAGSYVSIDRVRFDFSHYAPLTREELVAVEQLVNNMISAGADVETVETDIESAKKAGAMALFGEKYGKTVRMVKMGDLSTELCGGTHVKNTAEIGLFKIISESSVAAGVRRIEATTGLGVLQLLAEKEALIAETAKELKVQNPLDIAKKASALQSELKSANSENEALKAKIAAEKLSSITANKEEFCGIHLVMATVTDTAPDAVRNVCDNLRTDDSLSVALIAVVNGGKMNLIASCGKDAQAKGMHAGNIAKTAATICGGGGGGRPDSAMAGGKNPEKIDEAFAAVRAFIEGAAC
jgi:alanyl-tRNA synthetase